MRPVDNEHIVFLYYSSEGKEFPHSVEVLRKHDIKIVFFYTKDDVLQNIEEGRGSRIFVTDYDEHNKGDISLVNKVHAYQKVPVLLLRDFNDSGTVDNNVIRIVDGLAPKDLSAASLREMSLIALRQFNERMELTRELKERKSFADAILNSSSTGFARAYNRKIVMYNDVMAGMFGVTIDEYIGQDALVLYRDEEEYNRIGVIIQDDIERGKGTEIDALFKRKDGTVFHGLLRIGFLNGEEDRVISIIDISRRKKIEEDLKLSESRYRELAELLPQAVSEVDSQGKVTFVNEYGLKMFGYSREDFKKGVYVFEIVRPETNPGVIENFRKSLKGEVGKGREYNALTRDGRSFPVLLYSSPIIQEGKPQGIRAIVIDMSDKKKQEEELRQREQNFRVIFENSPMGFVHLNTEGTIISCNERFAEIIGAPRDVLIGFNTLESITNEKMVFAIKESLSGREGHFEGEYVSVVTGKKSHMRLYANPVSPGEAPSEAIGVMEDITVRMREKRERERIEAHLSSKQKMETIGNLAGGIAHDFNNLLTPVIGHAEIIKGLLPSGSPLKGDLQSILKASHQARELIRQILVFSRGDEGAKRPVRLSDSLNEVAHLLKPYLTYNIEFIIDKMSDDCHVIADPTRIVQVIMNLGTNAVQSMGKEGGTLEVSVKEINGPEEMPGTVSLQGEGPFVQITVSDTGPGIDDDIRDRIFEPFFSTRRKKGGSGLGLSVVHGIVNSYKGAVIVENRPGGGTVFRVFLHAAKKEDLKKEEGIKKTVIPRGGKELILVVDDRKDVLSTVKRILEHYNYRVVSADCGYDALKIFQEQKEFIHLLLTDLTMPRMTGIELVREVKKVNPALPAILMTGQNELDKSLDMKGTGIFDIIYKPIMANKIMHMIREALAVEEINTVNGPIGG